MAERTAVPFQQFFCDVPVAIPGTFPHLIAYGIDNAVHDRRIEPKDDDLWMSERFVKTEGVGEARPLRVLCNHVHEPSMFFAPLKNALVILA